MNKKAKKTAEPQLANWLAGGGEMGERMRNFDWAGTSLGPVETWPQSLKTALGILLNSGYPMYIAWGQDFIQFYNDAYCPILGQSKHPALGLGTPETFAEIWDFIGPMFRRVMSDGEATTLTDQLLPLDRNGYVEECYFIFSYSAIRDEAKGTGGVFVTVLETTARVLAERRIKTLRELAAQSINARQAEEVCRVAAETLAANAHDIPFALVYVIDEEGKQARLAGTAGTASGTATSPGIVDLEAADATAWPLAAVISTGKAELVEGLEEKFRDLPLGIWQQSPHEAMVMPVTLPGHAQPSLLLVLAISPRKAFDNEYRNFFDLIAGQMATTLAEALAYEEERNRAEVLAELDRVKTDFFSNISHEFRTPLTLMLGPLEDMLTQSNGSLPAPERQELEVVHRNGVRLLKLVNTLLDFSRIEAGRAQAVYEPVDLAAFTAELASVFRSAIERAGMRLIVNCPPLKEPAYVDREMWEKIVLNLLSNAFKFTFEGEIEISLRERGGRVELTVRDTGTGIAASELPHIFDRFHRVHGAQGRTHEGTGIGLALVRELVKLHDGTVSVESKTGKGSAFVVSIPTGFAHLPAEHIGSARTLVSTATGPTAYVEEALRWLPENDGETGRRRDKETIRGEYLHAEDTISPSRGVSPSLCPRILLADDNADMRDYVRQLLSQHWEVEAVADGKAALEAARRRIPDLVLTDVMMPRMDGFELLRELRAEERTREIPVILLSARAGEESKIEGLAAGADDYLIKPFSAKELIARVDAHLRLQQIKHQSAEELRRSEERYRAFVEQSFEAIWRAEMREPVPTKLPQDEQIEMFYRHAYLAECNDAMARMYGFERAADLTGVGLGDLMPRADQANIDYLLAFIRAGHRLTEAESHELDRDGNPKYFLNNLIGIIEGEGEDARLIRAWGTQRDITASRQAEKALRESEHQLRAIYDGTHEYIGLLTPDGTLIEANRASLEFGPSKRDELVGLPFWETVWFNHTPGAPELVRQAITQAAAGEFVRFEAPIINPSGQTMTFDISLYPIRNEKGEVILIVPEGRDITEIKRQEAELQELSLQLQQRNQIFDATLSHISDFAYIFDRNGRFLYANQPLLDLLGLPLEDVVGKNFFDLQYPDDLAARLQRQIQQVFETGQGLTDETPYTSPTGKDGYYEYIFRPVFGADGSVEVVAGSTRDVTKHKHDEQRARDGEARYRQLADAMPQLVWTCGADGVVDYYNSRLADYVEVEHTAEGRWQWHPLLHPDDVAPTLARWQRSMETGEPYEFEHRLQMHDGRYCWHLSRARAGYDADGRIVKWFGTATDIDSNKRVELNAQFLLGLDTQLNRLATADEIEQAALDMLGAYLVVQQCNFGRVEGERMVMAREWRRSGPSFVNTYLMEDYFPPESRALLQSGSSLIVTDAATDPRVAGEAANYAALQIGGFITTPVFYQGQWVGALNVVSQTPRRWHADEIQLLRDVAGRVWPLIERAQAVAAVQKSEASFRLLADAMPQIVWVRSEHGANIEYINARWLDYTGLSYEESRLNASQAIHPDDLQTASEKWRESYQTGSPFEAEMRIRRADGAYRWFLARSVPLHDAEGRAVRWFGTSTDIHEKKQSEADVRLLAGIGERIRLAEDAPTLLWEVTQMLGEHLQAANCFFTEVETGQDRFLIHRDYHASPRSFAGSYARSAYGPALIVELTAGRVVVVRDAASDPRIADSFDNFKQSGIGALIAVPLLRDDQQVSSLIITAPDARDWTPREVTLLETVAERTWLGVEKLRLDAQMQRTNERFERAEAASRGFVYEWDLLTNKAERTSGLTAMLGYRLDEIPGDTDGWRMLLHPEDAARVAELDAKSPADGEGYSLEYRVRHKDGHYVWVWDQWRTSFDEQQRPVRLIGSVIDISDRRRKEEQIALLLEEEQAARANAERATRLKDEFLGLVSHELRSPLNAINGWIKLLRGGKLTADETAKALATIERNAQAQNRLIEDLLDVSRVIAGKFRLEPQVIEPHTAIEAAFDTARPAAEAKGIQMELLSAPLGIALNADPNRLQQAIWNLLSNAIKFTPAGGRVTVRLATAGNQIEISVIDTGIGIERDFLPYVFERFRQADATSSRKYGGLGLGLAIVRHIVELHGGEVKADSQGEGCGAAFTIQLPLATAGQTTQEPSLSVASTMELPPEIAARLTGLRVLAIDDEEADREMLRAMLHSYGVQVTTAASAAEGFETMRGGIFDALVCDIAMPGGDGYTFIRQVREREAGSGSRLPAIALTAYARGEDRVRTLGAGFDSHVSKPVEPVELAIVLATLAGRSGK